MLAVPPATAVTVAVLEVPVAATAVATAVDEDPQVRLGAMGCPAMSMTSAVTFCVLGTVSEKDVPEPPDWCTAMLATGQVV